MLWLVPNSLKKPTSFGPELLVRFCGRFCQRRCVASVPADALRAHSRSSTDGTAHADQFCDLDPLSLIPVIPFYAEIQGMRETIETPARDRISL